MTPSSIDLPLDAEVTLLIWNNASETFSLSLSPPYRRSIAEIHPGESRYMNFTADKPTAGTSCVCQVVDEGYDDEVRATLTVAPETSDLPGYSRDVRAEGPWMEVLVAMALLILAMAIFVALRPRRTVDGEEGQGTADPGPDRTGKEGEP